MFRPGKPKDQNLAKQSAANSRHKSLDKDRWRNVAVWLIPCLLTIVITVAVTAGGTMAIWAAVVTAITFVAYVLFLLEWYILKGNRTRMIARILCAVLFIGFVAFGGIRQYRMPQAPQRFSLAAELVLGSPQRDMNASFW